MMRAFAPHGANAYDAVLGGVGCGGGGGGVRGGGGGGGGWGGGGAGGWEEGSLLCRSKHKKAPFRGYPE